MPRLIPSCRARVVARRAATVASGLFLCVWTLDVSAQSDRRRQDRFEEALRREGDALVRLADDASRGRTARADFRLDWRNDFIKAQPGTFVPFTITFDMSALALPRALMYVRAERVGVKRGGVGFETIFPVRLDQQTGATAVVRRGFAVPAGRYRVVVAIREGPEDPLVQVPDRDRKAAVLVRELDVPDFWTGELTTSTVILAERIEPLPEPIPAGELDENPYAVGSQRIHPAASQTFSRNNELIVVFLIYNPTVGPDRHFDVHVEYHVFGADPGSGGSLSKGAEHPAGRAGERYVTRTTPQRFNPSLMGGDFDPASGAPILAGQGILLAGFEPGRYRLGITITDLLSRKTLTRDVTFTVVGS